MALTTAQAFQLVDAVFGEAGVPLWYHSTGGYEHPAARRRRLAAALAQGSLTEADLRTSVSRLGAQYKADGGRPVAPATTPQPRRSRLDYGASGYDPRTRRPMSNPRPGGGTTTPPAPGVAPEENRSARAVLEQLLRDYDLDTPAMREWAWSLIQGDATREQVENELYQRPEFKERFWAIEQFRAKGMPVSAGDVLEYERTTRGLLRDARIPQNLFATNRQLQELWVQGWSPAHLDTVIREGYQRVQRARPSIRQAFAELYGADGDAALAMTFLDPQRSLPELERMVRVAEVSGVARDHDVHLERFRAEQLADAGIDASAMQGGLAELESVEHLFTETVSEGEDMTLEAHGLDAVFNLGADGRRALDGRRAAREASTAGGGGAVSGQRGIVGAGVAT